MQITLRTTVPTAGDAGRISCISTFGNTGKPGTSAVVVIKPSLQPTQRPAPLPGNPAANNHTMPDEGDPQQSLPQDKQAFRAQAQARFDEALARIEAVQDQPTPAPLWYRALQAVGPASAAVVVTLTWTTPQRWWGFAAAIALALVISFVVFLFRPKSAAEQQAEHEMHAAIDDVRWLAEEAQRQQSKPPPSQT